VNPPAPPEASIDSAELFRRHARFVASFLHRQGVRGADLEDAVQEVFLAAHQRGGYRSGVASPQTFLARLALETNLKRRRTQHRALRDHASDAASATRGAEPSDPAQSLAVKDAARRLEAVLAAMDEGQRAVFILFELEGQSCEAIAAGLEVPLGTVYSRLHNARKTFRAELAADARSSLKKKPERLGALTVQPLLRRESP
jgi:RNA polymerase sigma-70 factor (ECF subfamily)